jgi:hypothetical protein
MNGATVTDSGTNGDEFIEQIKKSKNIEEKFKEKIKQREKDWTRDSNSSIITWQGRVYVPKEKRLREEIIHFHPRLLYGRTSRKVQNGGTNTPKLLVAWTTLRRKTICERVRKMSTNKNLSGETARNTITKHYSDAKLATYFCRSYYYSSF